MRTFLFLLVFPVLMQGQSNNLDTNIYFSFHVNVSTPFNPSLIDDDKGIHGLGIGYSFGFDKMILSNSLGFSIKYLQQTHLINTIHEYSYTEGILQEPSSAPIIDPDAKINSRSLLVGFNYQFSIDSKIILQPKILGGLNFGNFQAKFPITYVGNEEESPKTLEPSEFSIRPALMLEINSMVPINSNAFLKFGASYFLSSLDLTDYYLPNTQYRLPFRNFNLYSGICLKI